MEHDIPFGNSNRGNGTTFLDFPLFLGIFQWDEPTKRVPFTAEPEIPEILTKWKAPNISKSIIHTCAFIIKGDRDFSCPSRLGYFPSKQMLSSGIDVQHPPRGSVQQKPWLSS